MNRCDLCGAYRERLTRVTSENAAAMLCERCTPVLRRPMWLQRQDENGARDLTGQVRS